MRTLLSVLTELCLGALRRFGADGRGNVSVIFAVAGPVMVAFSALAIDVALWELSQNAVQGAADAASLSAIASAGAGDSVARAKAEAQSVAALSGFVNGTGGVTVTVNNPPASGSHTANAGAYEVIISKPQSLYFGKIVVSQAPTVSGRAVSVGGTTCNVTSGGSGTTYTLTNGNTTSVPGDVNGQTITVTGNGVLALGHDANNAHITINSPCATITLAHDFNSGVFVDTATPSGKNLVNIGDATGRNGVTYTGGSEGAGGVFSITHDANGASFTFDACGSCGSGQGVPVE